MLLQYIEQGMRHATYEWLPEDRLYYGEIPPCQGVLATGASLETCRQALQDVLEDWVLIRIHRHLPLPVIAGVSIAVRETA